MSRFSRLMADDIPVDVPFDEYLERGVLGSLLAQPDREHSRMILRDLSFLEPDDFWRTADRNVFVAIRRIAHQGDGSCLVGDLFHLKSEQDGLVGHELTALVIESLDGSIVKDAALRLAELMIERLMLQAPRVGSPGQLRNLNGRIEARQAVIERARSGAPPGEAYDPLAEPR